MSVSTDATPRVAGAGEPPQPRSETLAATLFPAARHRAVTWRVVALTAGAVLAGTLLGLGRTRGPGSLNSIWAEDASIVLSDALNTSFWHALTTPLNGYFITVPRLLGEVAVLIPVRWDAALLSTEAALAAALMAVAVYVASGAHLRSPVLRFAVSAPVVATPVGGLFAPHELVTLQFPALYTIFWILLWVPATRSGRAVCVTFILLIGLSSVLTIAMLPLAVLRLVLRRDRHSAALLGALVAGLAVQFGAMLWGTSSRTGISHPHPDPIWALAEYVVWGLPYSVLGQHWMEPPINFQNGHWSTPVVKHTVEHLGLIVVAWLVIGLVVLVAVRRITRPLWTLAAVAGAYSVLILATEMMGMGYQSRTYLVPEEALVVTDRYLIPPALLLLVAVVALLRPDPGFGLRPSQWPANAWPVLMYLTLVVTVCAANLRHDNPRAMSRPWSSVVAQAAAECRASGARTAGVPAGSQWWGGGWPAVTIPCSRVR